MTYTMKKLASSINASLLALLAFALPLAAQAAPAEQGNKVRALTMTVEAKVIAVDVATRQLSLQGPAGNHMTLAVSESVGPMDDIKVGDIIEAYKEVEVLKKL